MKRKLKQRVLVSTTGTLVAAVCGLLVGGWVGREIVLQHASERLSHEATRAIAQSVGYSVEAHSMFDAMSAGAKPACSQEDIEFLHNLLYKAFLLKEIGRVHGNRIGCSTTSGRASSPSAELPKPDSIGADGVKVYRNPAGFGLPQQAVTLLQQKDSYVVLNPAVNAFRESSPLHMKTTVIGPPHDNFARPEERNSDAPRPITTRDNDFRNGSMLSSTRCSVQFNTCKTASFSVAEALAEKQGELKGFIVLGGVIGGLFGLILSLLYRRNASLEQQLRRAIRIDHLHLVYQPIVSLPSGRIVGAEALARWTDEEGEAVGPDIFVKIAEDHGFVGEITKFVIRTALAEFGETLRRRPGFRLSINVAAADLSDPGFLNMLGKSLDESKVKAESLAIEITESSTARHEVAIAAILKLSRAGLEVHIDDFGTGYSSLSYLNGLAIHAIKIDRSFTQAIGTEAVTVSILPQILAMAAALKLNVIVEGVETAQQAGYFAGCGQPVLAQGWLYGRPISAEQFHEHFGKAERRAMSPAEHIPAEVCSVS